ncbi:MAG: efflux RND transporter periplasmic adaptor subunit [Nitrosomonadaceae bacterium]
MIKEQLVMCIFAGVFMVTQASNLYAEELVLSTLGCMLQPSKKVQISSPVAGVLDKVLVKRGDSIKKGNTLFQLKAGVEKEAVKLASVRAEFAKRKAQRNKDLYDEDILTAHERDEIETELLIAKSELRLQQQELALRKVSSPINGVVVNRFNNKGEYVNSEPIMSLATLDPLHIDLLLPSTYFGQISLKQQLLIKPESDTIDARIAKVIIVDPLIDSASGTFRVQLEMSNPGNKIPAGIRCSAQIINEP